MKSFHTSLTFNTFLLKDRSNMFKILNLNILKNDYIIFILNNIKLLKIFFLIYL